MTPTSQTVAENETAVFSCSIDAGNLRWYVDGNPIDSNGNPDFIPSNYPSDGEPPVHTLSIVARCDYNGARVECFALFLNPTGNMMSGEVNLTIQGIHVRSWYIYCFNLPIKFYMAWFAIHVL